MLRMNTLGGAAAILLASTTLSSAQDTDRDRFCRQADANMAAIRAETGTQPRIPDDCRPGIENGAVTFAGLPGRHVPSPPDEDGGDDTDGEDDTDGGDDEGPGDEDEGEDPGDEDDGDGDGGDEPGDPGEETETERHGNASANNGRGGNYDRTGHEDNGRGNGRGRN
jgi:hypothetical protein